MAKKEGGLLVRMVMGISVNLLSKASQVHSSFLGIADCTRTQFFIPQVPGIVAKQILLQPIDLQTIAFDFYPT
jgi:hypothetical protein